MKEKSELSIVKNVTTTICCGLYVILDTICCDYVGVLTLGKKSSPSGLGGEIFDLSGKAVKTAKF